MRTAAAILFSYMLMNYASAQSIVMINPDIFKNPSELAAANVARNSVLNSCGTIMMMTPSTREPGAWIIDCANGDRYRMAAGSNLAKFERSYPPNR